MGRGGKPRSFLIGSGWPHLVRVLSPPLRKRPASVDRFDDALIAWCTGTDCGARPSLYHPRSDLCLHQATLCCHYHSGGAEIRIEFLRPERKASCIRCGLPAWPNPSTVMMSAPPNPLPFSNRTGRFTINDNGTGTALSPSIARLFGSGQAKVTAEQIDEDLFLINNELVRRNSI